MAKHGLLTPAGAKVIAGLILNYTLPALLFAKMVTCVNPDNVAELGFVALIAVLYIVMGAIFGLMIQRTKLVPKRLYWGIVAATMFTNFGDLPISIILAVSDHPPFLVGDGARGTAYSSVFISVFYLFLFPLGGYRLIRYDHIKESKRLQNLTATLQHEQLGNSPNESSYTLSGHTATLHTDANQQQYQQAHQQSPHHLSSPAQHNFLRQDSNGLQSSFSATSTMISMDCTADENIKELSPMPPTNFGASGSCAAGTTDPRVIVEDMTMVPLSEPGMSSSPQFIGPPSGVTTAEEGPVSVPKVPPHLEKSYASNHNETTSWFWRAFHSTREYLTPPTIGLIIGLTSALTPLRALFVPTANPLPSPDDLPLLSFILEVTLMLGACCVPLGLTVLGASLSRLKPGRLRPMIPALTMITVVKLVISPCLGIMLVQLVLVKRLGWVGVQNHMMQFTLMLMSGSPTSITCFVLAQVWDRRTKNAGSEMAALIAVQYAVATVLLTVGSAFMMYFLF
ncbi:Protein M3 [Mortierella sp. GBA43]|nr:Protein M3 [Mortierella sp. GBA43]